MRKTILAFLAFGMLLLLGCTSTYYVCPNGDKVSTPEECAPAETPAELECSPSSMSTRCEGSSLFYDYTCVEGGWQHSATQCEFGCEDAACTQPECPSSCSDQKECTADSCGPETNYECEHTPLTNSQCSEGEKLCFPAPIPSDSTYARMALYESEQNLRENLQAVMGSMALGENATAPSGASVRLETIVSPGACSFCGDTPRLSGTKQAKFVIPAFSNVAMEQTILVNAGQSAKFCAKGTCVADGDNPCATLQCSTYNWVKVMEISVGQWTCS